MPHRAAGDKGLGGLTGAALAAGWAQAAACLAALRDVVLGRADEGEIPAWATARGWAGWLLGLPDHAVEACEAEGLRAHARALGAPATLVAGLEAAAAASALPLLRPAAAEGMRPEAGIGARKALQLAAFARLAAPLGATAQRVVDVGAGHGHLTRALAEALAVEGLGVERDARLLATARARAAGRPVRFLALELGVQAAPPLSPTDLVVGLHACGALTETLCAHAAQARAAVICVSCCLHKVPAAGWRPRIDPPAGVSREALALPQACLGLANLSEGSAGVEAGLEIRLAARARRLSLWCLLQGRGLALAPGDAMAGLNRRAAQRPFPALAAAALARRGLPGATAAELAAAEVEGSWRFARARRLELVRKPLGRLIEVSVNLERASWLAAQGYQPHLGVLWPAAVSPRNVALCAAAPQ